MTGDVLVAAQGWLWWPPSSVYVQVARDEQDRLSVAAVHLDGREQALTAARLRAVPLGRIEAACAGADLHARLLQAWEDPERGGARSLLALHVLQGMVASRPPEGMRAPAPARRTLSRPGPAPAPEFYREVAGEYLLRAAETRAPATALAREAGVPVGTVHRWVREARRQGHLPSGRSGRAG